MSHKKQFIGSIMAAAPEVATPSCFRPAAPLFIEFTSIAIGIVAGKLKLKKLASEASLFTQTIQ